MTEIIFIGTGSGKISIKRNHSSILIKTTQHNFLIDAGDGISSALMKLNQNFDSIDCIIFSHYHADHFAGIASIVTQMKLISRVKPLQLFTHKNLIASLELLLNTVYMFKENLGFNLTIEGFGFDKTVSVNNDIQFVAKKNSHILQKENLKQYPAEMFVSSSLLFEINGKGILYTSDIGSKDDIYLFKDQRVDYLITESTHIRLEDIYEAWGKIKPQKLFITHIDDESEPVLEKWYKKLTEDEKKKIVVCYDGLSFQII